MKKIVFIDHIFFTYGLKECPSIIKLYITFLSPMWCLWTDVDSRNQNAV